MQHSFGYRFYISRLHFLCLPVQLETLAMGSEQMGKTLFGQITTTTTSATIRQQQQQRRQQQ